MKQLKSLTIALGISASTLLSGCYGGEFPVLTYNTHGLNKTFTGANPEENLPKISPLLNSYDLVLIQENFVPSYGLFDEAEHPYILPKRLFEENEDNRSGLSRLSYFPTERKHAESWHNCYGYINNGSDCLAPKGFTVFEHEVIPEVWIDVYNLHMDAGDSPKDREAREAQIEQLVNILYRRSINKAVIVAGDTNLDLADRHLLEKLLLEGGLQDSCEVLDCPQPNSIDKVLFKSSYLVHLEPLSWQIPSNFVNDRGQPLSDHSPIVVDFKVSVGYYE